MSLRHAGGGGRAIVRPTSRDRYAVSPHRRAFLADMVRLTAALPLLDWSHGRAQQRVPRIGFMSGAEPSLIASFEDEMRKLGYSPGRNIHLETRIARRNTNDTAVHAAELGAMDLDFIVVAEMIVDVAAARRLPAAYQSLFFVESGGLMAWAPDQHDQYRAGARLADQILKGRKPGDLPVQHPEPYQLHLNKRAAAAMNLTLPADLVAEADKVLS